MDVSPRGRLVLVALVVTAVPSAWGLEVALRVALFPPDFEELRAWLRPELTVAARGLLVLTLALAWPSYLLMRRVTRKRLRMLPARRPDLRVGVRLLAYLAASSLLQLPGLLLTLAYTFGAELRPVASGIALGTLGLAGLGAKTLRDCAHEGAGGHEKILDGSPPSP